MSSLKVRLDSVVRGRHQLSWTKARDWIASGKIWLAGAPATDPGLLVSPDVELEVRMNAPRSKAAATATGGSALDPSLVVFSDSQLVVVNKPAGMNTVPYEDEKNSLEQLVSRFLGQARLVVVHRIDRETSGLVVFARTKAAGEHLGEQFRRHTVWRRYFALAEGRVVDKTIRSALVENRGDGLRGSVSPKARPDAKLAVTHVTPLLAFDGMTLIECRLETGRTHQIRIHLAEDGHPLLGEKAYNRYHEGVRLAAPRLMLHAGTLGLTHPTREAKLSWSALPPQDFLELIGPAGRRKLEERAADHGSGPEAGA